VAVFELGLVFLASKNDDFVCADGSRGRVSPHDQVILHAHGDPGAALWHVEHLDGLQKIKS